MVTEVAMGVAVFKKMELRGDTQGEQLWTDV
jgi:hypothetical protein